MLARKWIVVVAVVGCWTPSLWAEGKLVHDAPAAGDFSLVANHAAADVVVDAEDYKVVQIVAGLFAGDVQQVTGIAPRVSHEAGRGAGKAGGGGRVVYAGTLGHSPIVDGILRDKHVDTSAIENKWESYLVTMVHQPAPGVDEGLLVVGSDRRGTAYGLLEMSEEMGVSPWNWWADVPAEKHESLYVGASGYVQGPPSVKYRGIFLNDEDWGLQPWAAKTFEPETKDIGPKTYAKIFELLLRLRANLCWPAMHDVTRAFNLYPKNKQVADDYGIVMGSSHCEPMLRNNVTEWGKEKAKSYNYFTNREGVLNYWKQRVEENGRFENIYTLGMRGIHDSDMAGGGTPAERAKLLNQIIVDQRNLLKRYVNPDVAKVPQIFCPYKEVLSLYHLGVVPPADVTLVWADDNYGYIRELASAAERAGRGDAGGFGVYYHLSYWGSPHDYLWLCTTPPALVWEELSKAYDYDSRNVWVMNVGDLKPAEIDITLAMQMAYDIHRYTRENLDTFLRGFSTRTFGTGHAAEIADILDEYYHLNFQRKPEHLGFNTSQRPAGVIQPTPFTNEEIKSRLAAFDVLVARTNAIYDALPREQRDAFYELVVYPVRGSALQNQKLLYADLNRRAVTPAEAQAAAEKSKAAYEKIQEETRYFNDSVAGGKWKYIMSDVPHGTDVFKLPKYGTGGERLTNAPSAPAAVEATVPVPASHEKMTFAAANGYVSMAAEHFTRVVDRANAGWKVIPGLGRFGDSMAVFPTTTASITAPDKLRADAPSLEYDFKILHDDDAARVEVQAIPTHGINAEHGARYAVAVDDERPQIVDLEQPENSATWAANVLRNCAVGITKHVIRAGRHTLHIYMVDPGVVLDHVVVDLGGLPRSYLPSAETWGH